MPSTIQPTKYLNFDIVTTGFTVTPSVGALWSRASLLPPPMTHGSAIPAAICSKVLSMGFPSLEIAKQQRAAIPARFDKQVLFLRKFAGLQSLSVDLPHRRQRSNCGEQHADLEVDFWVRLADLPQDITQPGDPIVASSTRSPGSEGVANAIDDQPNKYLNFDIVNTGFTVSPVAGLTLVSGLTSLRANDALSATRLVYAGRRL